MVAATYDRGGGQACTGRHRQARGETGGQARGSHHGRPAPTHTQRRRGLGWWWWRGWVVCAGASCCKYMPHITHQWAVGARLGYARAYVSSIALKYYISEDSCVPFFRGSLPSRALPFSPLVSAQVVCRHALAFPACTSRLAPNSPPVCGFLSWIPAHLVTYTHSRNT